MYWSGFCTSWSTKFGVCLINRIMALQSSSACRKTGVRGIVMGSPVMAMLIWVNLFLPPGILRLACCMRPAIFWYLLRGAVRIRSIFWIKRQLLSHFPGVVGLYTFYHRNSTLGFPCCRLRGPHPGLTSFSDTGSPPPCLVSDGGRNNKRMPCGLNRERWSRFFVLIVRHSNKVANIHAN